MSKSNKNKEKSSKKTNNILFEDFELPDLDKSVDIFKNRYFKRELLPLENNNKNRILIRCSQCDFTSKSSWPINTSNYKTHLENKHKFLKNLDITSETSSNIESTTSNTITSYLNPTINTLRKRKSFTLFDSEEYIRLILNFIINNNLPFSIIDSKSFKELLKYLKDELPTISRKSIKNRLDILYNSEFKKLKDLLARNNSKFSITLDEWNSSNNIDFLAITLHFYNNKFELKNYLIAFEYLNEDESYTGNLLFDILNNILKEYTIRQKLLAITRDNARPMNNLVNITRSQYLERYNIQIIDNRCAAHILNLIFNSFLNYTFFISNNTKKFNSKIQDLNIKFINYKDLYLSMRSLPSIIKSIIKAIRNNHYLKNNFRKLVLEYKAKNKAKNKPKKLILDNSTRWLSTYNMLDRFIYFKKEIAILLKRVNNLEKKKRDNINIDSFNISENEWNYLIKLRNILEIFRKPTIKLQSSNYSSIYFTIPYITKLLVELDKLTINIDNIQEENLYIAIALLEAYNKLKEYFPIKNNNNISILKHLYLATLLNPQFKLRYFEDNNFPYIIIEQIKEYFIIIYKEYKENYNKSLNIDS